VEKKRGGARKTKKVKVSKRSLVDHPYLYADLNLKSRYEEIIEIAGYADSLNKEDKEWLNSFVAEYVCADFKHGGEIVNISKEDRSICWAKNNNRNNCIFNKEKSYGSLNYLEELTIGELSDVMISDVDYILQLDDAEFDKSTKTDKKNTKKPSSSLKKR